MLKWLQGRLKKKRRHLTPEYRVIGHSSNRIFYSDDQLNVAEEATEVETENGTLERDSAEIFKDDQVTRMEQKFSHVPRMLGLPDNFEDENYAVSEIGRGAVVYSECNELSFELCNQISKRTTHNVKSSLSSKKQDDRVLSVSQGADNSLGAEKLTPGTLTINSSGFSQDEEECETLLQAQGSRILPVSQDGELLEEAKDVSVATPCISQEDVASSFRIQACHHDNQSAEYNTIPVEESSARHKNAEMKAEYVSGNSEHCLSSEWRKTLGPSTNLPIGEENSTIHPHPCCPQLSCFYNQPGQLCMVLGEQYILTYVKDTPVLVNIHIETSKNGPFGCLFLWREGKPIVLAELPEGTNLYFDAVVMPDTTKFIAVVIWQVSKPLISIEPYFDSYVFVEEIEELKVDFISFGKKNGVVSATIETKTKFVSFSNSVVFINGKKTENKADILKLFKCSSQHLFANVCKFVGIDSAGKVTYDFVCSCLWSGFKPPAASQTSILNSLMLYKKKCNLFTEGKQQLSLYCDVDAEIIVKENGLFLVYERDNEAITISCTLSKIHCGNKSIVNIAGGKAKAHVRKQVSKNGDSKWNVLLIQVSDMVFSENSEVRSTNMYGWKAAAVELCSDKMSRNGNTVLKSVLSDEARLVKDSDEHMVKPEAGTCQIDNEDLEPPLTISQSTLVPSYYVNKVSGNSVTGIDKEHYVKVASPESKMSMENSLEDLTLMNTAVDKLGTMLVYSRGQSNHNTFNDIVEDENNDMNFKIMDSGETHNQTEVRSHIHISEYGHRPKEYPKVLKNCHGKLNWVDSKVFKIYTKLYGTHYEVSLGNKAWIATNGIIVKVAQNTVGLPVCFDMYYDDHVLQGYHVVALWEGEKPKKATTNRNVTYFYDVHGAYLGSDGCDMKFLVFLDDCMIPIKTSNTDRIFTVEGKQCKSLPLNSSVVLHLKTSIDQVPDQVHWIALLIIVQAEQEHSDSEPLVGAKHDFLPNWPVSHPTGHHSLSDFTKDSNGNHEKILRISAKPVSIQQCEEYHEENDTPKQIMTSFTKDYPGRSQTWDLENRESLEENSQCFDPSGGNIVFILKDASIFEYFCCQILIIWDEFAVLKARNKIIVARKREFYQGDTKMLPSLSLHELLNKVRSVGAFVTEIAQRVYMQQFEITHFALLAFRGKKPKAAESILAAWEKQDIKRVNLHEKLKVTSETEFTLSSVIIKGKIIETKTAKIYKLMVCSGILEVQSERFQGEKVRIFFTGGEVYIDKKAIPEKQPLSELMGPLRQEPWGCVARPFPKKNSTRVSKVSGVEVHYIAILVWYGVKPSKEEIEAESVEKNKEQECKKNTESQISHYPKSKRKRKVKNIAVPPDRREDDMIGKNSSNPEIHKTESVAERLRRKVHNIQEDIEVCPTSRAKDMAETPSVSSWSSEEKIGTQKGCITEVRSVIGLLRLENGDQMYFSRGKCFLYGICLKKVELCHVLTVGLNVDYELTDDGMHIQCVWVGRNNPIKPSNLLSKLYEWCEAYSVPKATADILVTDAGWISHELDPTIDFSEEKEVVDLSHAA